MENNLAVLIDFENIAAGTEKEGLGRFDVDALMTRIKEKGRILVARSYGDWGRFSRFKQTLLMANVTMMELTSHGMQDKNRADIALVVDALELAYTRSYLDTFVVVSGDSDFTPMVLKMRELNKRVIGIGTRGSTSRLLIQACDEFIYYDSLVQRPEPKRHPQAPAGESMNLKAAFGLLVETLEGLQREDAETPLASIVKTAMLRKSPDFSEVDLGYNSFARFLDFAQERGLVKLSRDPKSGGYRVESPEHQNGGPRQPLAAATQTAQGQQSQQQAPQSGNTRTADWEDPYLPDGCSEMAEILAKAGIDPLAAPTRLAILEQLESLTSDRKNKRRKITVLFARDEIKKRLRRTHPDLPADAIRSVLNALLLAGMLVHRDGSAIRSGSAPFSVSKSARQMNEGLMGFYLAHLRAEGVSLGNPSLLADLFLGDPSRRREVETALAWLASGAQAEEARENLDLDLDDLLVFDESATRETTMETDEGDRTVPSVRRSELSDLPADLDDLLAMEPAPSKAAAPKPAEKAATRTEPKAAAKAAEAPADSDEKPASGRRRAGARKPAKAEDAASETSAAEPLPAEPEAPAEAKAAAAKAPAARGRGRKSTAAEDADLDSLLSSGSEPAPKASKSAASKSASKTEPVAAASESDDDKRPKKRRRERKPSDSIDANDLDSILDSHD